MARHGHKSSLGDDPTASEVFARRLKEVREWHSLSQAGLSRRLEELGHAIDRGRLAKLETGRALPKLDDVLAVAVVLDVSPLFLIVPPLGEKVRIGTEAIDAKTARRWIRGQEEEEAKAPLPGQSEAAFAAQRPEDEIPLEYRAAVRAYRPPKESA
jgi:transcriptional regulator with XRE-family HTH domain